MRESSRTGEATSTSARGQAGRWPLGIAAVAVLLIGGWLAKAQADAAAFDAALAAAGCGAARAVACFSERARAGLTPAEVARALPAPARIERYVAPVGGGPDSVLLERYVYRRGLGSWPIYIYYARGGGVVDVYAWDVPGLGGARAVSAAEAERWRRWPQ